MFDKLSGALQKVFRDLRGYGRLTEANVQDALREVRMALLEADVNFQVAKDFVARVKAQALGKEVLESVTPAQQVIKLVHDELVALLGGASRDFDTAVHPVRVLLLGLNGAGKTTTAGKLAAMWKKRGRRVLLVPCDLKRPAAVEQLRILAGQTGADFLPPAAGEDLLSFGRRAVARLAEGGCDVAIFDSAGRLQVEADLVAELKQLKEIIQPRNAILVLDAAIGQESVHVAETFHREVGLTGLILTKLDGDARGGAALSVQAAVGCPILMIGTGEKADNLEPFHPDRMASRILGMGDVVTLVEKAQAAMDIEQMQEMEQRLTKQTFTLDDFLAQMRQMKKLGPLENLLEMLPGAGRIPEHLRRQVGADSGREMKKAEAVICSMTAAERRRPGLLDASRRRRIARGSGTTVQDVNELIKNFERAAQMFKQMGQAQKKLLRFRK